MDDLNAMRASGKVAGRIGKGWLFAMSAWVWFGMVSFPMIVVYSSKSDFSDLSMFKYQVAGFVQFVSITFLLYFSRVYSGLKNSNKLQWSILSVLGLSLVLQAYGNETEIKTGIAYTLILLSAIICASTIWTWSIATARLVLVGSGVILCGFQTLSLIVLGFPENRWVGGIHPNLFGTAVLSAFILLQFGSGKIVNILKAVSVTVAIVISSRYSLLGSFIAQLVFYITYNRIQYKTAMYAAAAVVVVIIFADQLTDVFALDDPDRGFGSGFTGRQDAWSIAFNSIAENPWGIGYKRDPDPTFGAGHNGYLKIILEFGVFGGSVLILSLLMLVGRTLIRPYKIEELELRRFASARASGLVAFAIAAFFQPQILNVGDPFGITFLILLFGPDIKDVRGSAVYQEPSGRRDPFRSNPAGHLDDPRLM